MYEYLIYLNATQAAIRAGYSAKTAAQVACENLTKPNINAAISTATKDRMSIREILNDDFSIKPLDEWPDIWCECLSGFQMGELQEGNRIGKEMLGTLKTLRWYDKLKNLELIGKHTDLRAYADNKDTDQNMIVVLSKEDILLSGFLAISSDQPRGRPRKQ